MANERDFKIKIATEGAEQGVAAQQRLTEAQQALTVATQQYISVQSEQAKFAGLSGRTLEIARELDLRREMARAEREATRGFKEEVIGLTGAQKENVTAAEQVNLSQQAFSQILGRISPELAIAFQSSSNFARILTRIGEEGKTVEGIIGLLTSGVTKYGGALLTLAAGGVAFAAVKMLTDEWKRQEDQMKAVLEQMAKFDKAQEDQASKRQAGREDVLGAAIASGKAPTQEQLDRASQLLGGVGLRGTVDQGDAAKALGQLIDRIDSMDVDKLELMALLVGGGTDISRPIPGRELSQAAAQLESLRGEAARKRGLAGEGERPFLQSELERRGVGADDIEAIQKALADPDFKAAMEAFRQGRGVTSEEVPGAFMFSGQRTGTAGTGQLSIDETISLLVSAFHISPAAAGMLASILRGGGGGGSGGGNTTVNIYNNARIQQSGAASDVVSNGDRAAVKAEG